MEIGPNQIVHGFIGVRYPARHLRLRQMVGHKGKRLRIIIARL
jgi:hypothetical protein